ncbi:MAG TPA: chromate transporter [Firmicutes bacterium]|nr:chromate transporter [Bacillota bacterium]
MFPAFLKIFASFFKIGLFTIGGGYAMIPLMQTEFISVHHWLTSEEFIDIIAVAEMTPGPVAINSATYIGYQTLGVAGSIVATLGVISPSLIILLIIARLFKRFSASPMVKAVISSLRPAVIGLILTAVVVLGRSVLVDFKAVLIALTSFLLLCGGRAHPISVLAVSACLGILMY